MTAYLDWAATAIPDPEIYRRAAEKAAEAWANPSSQHREGKKAAESLENARRLCASVLGVPPETVFFTSGGTEADQIPLLSLLRRPAPGSAVISAIEHPAVRNQAEVLKKFGWTILPVNPDADGFITPEAVLAAIREDTAFAAVMCVNNETGAIQPVEEIAAALKTLGKRRIHFHTDAVQAAGMFPRTPETAGIHSMAFSGHKLGAPRGCGLLYCSPKPDPFLSGGGQEKGVRPGTENLAGAWAMAFALEKTARWFADPEQKAGAEDKAAFLFRKLTAIPGVTSIPPSRRERSGNFSPFLFQFTNAMFPGEVLVRMLSDAGICISTGSACSAKKKARPVLQAMKTGAKDAQNAFRISTGIRTTQEEIEFLAGTLSDILR